MLCVFIPLEITSSEIYGFNQTFNIKCHKNFFRSINKEEAILEEVCIASGYEGIGECWYLNVVTLVSYVVWTILAIKEIISLYCNGFIKYFWMLENWIEIFILISSMSFFIASPWKVEWAYHPLGWMVFLVWIDLLLYLGRFQTFGECIYMSLEAAKTMTLCIFTYSPSFFAFSFGFYVLLHSNENFSGCIRASIGVLAMMVDELNYNDNFDYNKVDEIGGRNVSVQVMFVVFMICMSLIVMNLLLAVTVNKTDNLAVRSKIIMAKRKINHLLGAREVFKIFKPFLRCLEYVTACIPMKMKFSSMSTSFLNRQKDVSDAYLYLNR